MTSQPVQEDDFVVLVAIQVTARNKMAAHQKVHALMPNPDVTDRWNVHYHRRTRIYPSHILRVFRPLNGGIGIVVWRHEVSLTRGCAA